MMEDEIQNRNSTCNCNQEMKQMNNDFNTLNSKINNMFMNNCENNTMTRENMMNEIKCCQFAVIELALYLDTHPDDEKALCLHRKYARDLKDLQDKYQKVYGSLTINFPCNKWRWLEELWPWERGNY